LKGLNLNINRETLRLYWQQARRHKTTFFIMLITIPLGATIIDSIMPYFLSQAIGALGSAPEQTKQLLITGGIVGIIGAILNYIGFQSMAIHESHVLAHLREETFRTLMKKDHHFFTNQKIGAMTSRYIDFVRNHVTIQDLFIIRTLGFVLSVGTGIVILFRESWLVAAIVISLIVLLIIEIRWSIRYRAPFRHERKTLVSDIHGHVADTLTNNLIVRSFASEKREIKSLQKMTTRFTKVYQKDIGFITAEGSTRVALMVIVQIVSIAISAQLVSAGNLTLGTAIFMLAYMQRIGSQLFVLGDILFGYDQALLDAQPMTEMILSPNLVSDAPSAKRLSAKKPSIVFDHISYKYPDNDEDVLKNITLDIPAGQKVGLVGHSGAGKSTIVQLLLRFSDVTDGSIIIGGKKITDITQESLRSHIAYVPQEPLLFHRSLRENISYGDPRANDAKVIEATKKANAYEFIKDLPHGLDTTVGERGVKLSGGQRQRIAIARANLKDSPILILDEATSALDSESERLIQASLDTLMKGRTSIVIAHRLSTIAKLDRIIVLEHGRVVEDGTHAELLKQRGIYASLWSHQSGGFLEDD
jgi:ATP-binding cassette subfamily B protein